MFDITAERRAAATAGSRQARVLAMLADEEPLATALGELVRLIEAECETMGCSIMLADEAQRLLFPLVADSLPAPFVAAAFGSACPSRTAPVPAGMAAARGPP